MAIEEADCCGEQHPKTAARCSLESNHRGPHWGHVPHGTWPQATDEVKGLRAERDGLNRTVAELRKEAPIVADGEGPVASSDCNHSRSSKPVRRIRGH